MLYRIDDSQADMLELIMNERKNNFETLDELNYADVCPGCGDGEFWHSGHCSHCGFDL